MNNYYNIDTNAHYFVLMHPVSRIPGSMFLVYASGSEYFVECEIQPYDIEGVDYKCYLVPVNEFDNSLFGKKEIYSSDFKDFLKKGRIIKKEHESDHVEYVRMAEHICGSAYIIHEGECIVSE